MFTEILLEIAKDGTNFNVHQQAKDKSVYMPMPENNFSAPRLSEILTMWMNFTVLKLREKNHIKEYIPCNSICIKFRR